MGGNGRSFDACADAVGKTGKQILRASSAAFHACRIFDVGPGIADEHISVRHPDRTQCLGAEIAGGTSRQ